MDDRKIYLTFDDGPHPLYTAQIIEILRQEKVKATFFLVGREINKYSNIARLIVDSGHSIGYHSCNHKRLSSVKLSELKQEINIMNNSLFLDFVNYKIKLFRPPYGEISLLKLFFFWLKNKKIVIWTIDSMDSFLTKGTEVIREFDKHNLNGGEIVLFHDDAGIAVKALPGIIDNIRNRGFKFGVLQN